MLTLLVILSANLSAAQVRLAYFHLPPHMIETKDGGRPAGALVEYFEKYIAKKMGIEIIWVGPYDSFKRLNHDASIGKFDMVSMVTKFPQAQDVYLFTKTPFKTGKHSIAVRANSKLNKIESYKDLNGLRIAHFSVDKSFYLDIFKHKTIAIEEVTGRDWFKRGMKMLVHNRLSAVYAPEEAPFIYNIYRNRLNDKVKILNLPVKFNIFYTVFNKKTRNANELIKKYDEVSLKVELSYQAYLNKYLLKLMKKIDFSYSSEGDRTLGMLF